MPGHEKIVSVMTAPANKVTNCREMMVSNVGSMNFKQCLKIMMCEGAPLSTDVLMKSVSRVSSKVDRVILEITAVEYQPKVIAGNTSDANPDRPDVGSQRNSTEKNLMSMMPTQNVGAAMPDKESHSKQWSHHVLGLIAHKMPEPTPTMIAKTIAATANSNVAGNLSHINAKTGVLNL